MNRAKRRIDCTATGLPRRDFFGSSHLSAVCQAKPSCESRLRLHAQTLGRIAIHHGRSKVMHRDACISATSPPPPPAVDRQCLALVLLTGLRWRGGTERDETTPLVVARQLRAGKESQQVPSETLPLGWAAPRSSRPCLGAATSPSQLRGLFGPRRSPVQESGRIVRVPSRPRVGPPHLRNTNEPNRHHTAGCPGSIRKCRRTRSEWTLTHGPCPDRAMHGRRPCGSQQPRLTVSRLEVRGARRAYEENREKSGKKKEKSPMRRAGAKGSGQ